MTKELPLPNAGKAEAAILGAIIKWGPQALADVHAITGDDALYFAPHKVIWTALRSLAEEGQALNRISVEAELRRRGTFGVAGGPQGVDAVIRAASERSADMLGHAVLIAEAAQVRAAGEFARAFAQELLVGEPLSGMALVSKLATAAEMLTEISRSGAGVQMPWTAAEVGEESARQMEAELTGGTRAISSGFPRLDWLLKRRGPRPGWLVVLSGRPKSGKTSAALQMAIEAMFDRSASWPSRWTLKERPSPVLFCCDEMKAAELYDRLAVNLAGLNASAYSSPTRQWFDTNRERIIEARRLIDSAPLHFVPDHHSGDITKALAYARRWRSKHTIISRDHDGNPVRVPALVVFDFLQAFAPIPGTERSSEREQIVAKAKCFKKAAKDLDVVLLLLSQLNRGLESREDKRPRASDNEGSGAIEQYGDVLIGTYRDIVYDDKEEEYRAQVDNLRGRVADAAREAKRSAGHDLRDLDELIALHRADPDSLRYSRLVERCALSSTEIEDIVKAAGKLSAAELIVQVNRHGPTGTVYVDFIGQHYRFLPRPGNGPGMPRDQDG